MFANEYNSIKEGDYEKKKSISLGYVKIVSL
jgi:hypothetical protein